MASNYTENYGLCQWEATDQVLRTEFNEDNAKMDAALNVLAEDIAQKADQTALDEMEALATKSRFTKIKETAIQNPTLTLEIDLSDIEWSRWDKVHVDCLTNNNDGVNLYYNTTDNANYRFSINGMWGLVHRPRLTFRVGFDAQRIIDVVWGAHTHVDTKTYADLTKLIITGDTMDPGALFTIWGEE